MIDFIALLLLMSPAFVVVAAVALIAMIFVEKTNDKVRDDCRRKN